MYSMSFNTTTVLLVLLLFTVDTESSHLTSTAELGLEEKFMFPYIPRRNSKIFPSYGCPSISGAPVETEVLFPPLFPKRQLGWAQLWERKGLVNVFISVCLTGAQSF